MSGTPHTDALPPTGTVVIVGAGLGGSLLAEQLRREGFTGTVHLVDGEPASYDRPPLSKQLFTDGFDLDAIALADAGRLARLDVHARFGRRAVELDAAARSVLLDDGTVLAADAVVLATGSRARPLAVPGADEAGVLTLHMFPDALALRERAAEGARFLVVGGGMVGAELTSALVGAGVEVTLVVRTAPPLALLLGDEMATRLHAQHARHGVEVVEATVAECYGSSHGTVALLSDGSRRRVDAVIAAIGAHARVRLGVWAGLDVDDGILVDAQHRTSAGGIYAVGDVARYRGTGAVRPPRREHWEGAQRDAEDLARLLTGKEPLPPAAAWFWSERYGQRFEMAGRIAPEGRTILRDDARRPAALHVEDGRLVGVGVIDDPLAMHAARQVIDAGDAVDERVLGDTGIPLRQAVQKARRDVS